MKSEDKAMKAIIRGETPEKRVMVGGWIPDPEKRAAEKVESEEYTKMMQQFRMPLFCPKCNRLMNKRLDRKTWMKMQVCFDCVIEMENKLRVNGTYNQYETKKIIENKLAWLVDIKQQLIDYIENYSDKLKFSEGEFIEEWSGGYKKEDVKVVVENTLKMIDRDIEDCKKEIDK